MTKTKIEFISLKGAAHLRQHSFWKTTFSSVQKYVYLRLRNFWTEVAKCRSHSFCYTIKSYDIVLAFFWNIFHSTCSDQTRSNSIYIYIYIYVYTINWEKMPFKVCISRKNVKAESHVKGYAGAVHNLDISSVSSNQPIATKLRIRIMPMIPDEFPLSQKWCQYVLKESK